MNGLPYSEAATHVAAGTLRRRRLPADGRRSSGARACRAAHVVLNPPFARATLGHTAVEAR